MNKTLLTLAIAGLSAASAMAQEFKWQAFYTQTYENVAQVGDVWTAPSNQGGLSIETEENGNHYVYYYNNGQNSRGMYNLDALTADMYEGIDEYRIEFDLALTPGNNQLTTFCVGSDDIQTMGSDWTTPCGNITQYPNNGLGSGALFALKQGSSIWRVFNQVPANADETAETIINVVLAPGEFYHYALTVSPNAKDPSVVDVVAEITKDGEPVMFTVETEQNPEAVEQSSVTLTYVPEASGTYWFKQFYVLNGRYNSILKIDNIQVMKKVDANSVTPPTLSMTGVKGNGRIISLDKGMNADDLTAYYALVDEATYSSLTSVEGLSGIAYTEPFVVSDDINYIVAWNINADGKASEPNKLTCEAGWTPKLNTPTITAIDFKGRNKTFQTTCDQSTVQPLAPLTYTIYMSTDSVNWEATDVYTVSEGKVYAKVEADGYESAACEGVEAPEGVYASTTWRAEGVVVNSTNNALFNFSNSGKGRVHVPAQYWAEDCAIDNGEAGVTYYDQENAFPLLLKNGLHFFSGNPSGVGDMFLVGSGNADGFTLTGLCNYNSNKGYIKIDNVQTGNIVQAVYNDGTARVFTVGDDVESFSIPVPQYGKGGALAAIEIKGEGEIETRAAKADEWGLLVSARTVNDITGADFYEHKYTIYSEDLQCADTLLLKPVASLEAGVVYFYKANADGIEFVYSPVEDPTDEVAPEQQEFEMGTIYAGFYEPIEDTGIYTMFGSTLMKNESKISVPEYSGCFMGLDGEFDNVYNETSDYKQQPEYTKFIADYEKAINDYENADTEYDEEGNEIEKPELDTTALWNEKLAALLANYTVIPVVHTYDPQVVGIQTAKKENTGRVNVVTPAGVVIRRNVNANEALNGLSRGLYIVGDKKVIK